jgi:sugar (pentulose or hexulose) kinase
MAHANNCTGEYDKWIGLFNEVLEATGRPIKKGELYDILLGKALEGDNDCGGLIPFNYLSGETMVGVKSGRPLFVRTSSCHFSLPNFMRAQLFTSLAALRTGMDILFENEQVQVDAINGHGGFFKTKEVGQKIMAAALHTPISILETAGEGGAWGIALLASYLVNGSNQKLEDFLNKQVFQDSKASTLEPDKKDIEGFNAFMTNFRKALPIERMAGEHIV